MAKTTYQNHPSNPAAQPFNGNGSKCKSKVQSWWNPASPNYMHRKNKKQESVNV